MPPSHAAQGECNQTSAFQSNFSALEHCVRVVTQNLCRHSANLPCETSKLVTAVISNNKNQVL